MLNKCLCRNSVSTEAVTPLRQKALFRCSVLFRCSAFIADGEGVLLAVATLYAPVFELDVDGAVGRAAHGEGAGVEDGTRTAEGTPSIKQTFAVVRVNYPPIPLSVVLLFLFGQFDGAAGYVQVLVKLDRHPFLTIGREVEVEEVVAFAPVVVFGFEDGLFHAV